MEFPKLIHYGVITGVKESEMQTGPWIEPGPEDVVVKMSICNICTNDYQHWIGSRNKPVPQAAGHETAGNIVWKGSKVSKLLEIGQQVSNNVNSCGVCWNCRNGHTEQCTGREGGDGPFEDGRFGRAPGQRGFADYMVINQRRIVQVANDIEPACAAFVEPFSAGIHGQRKAHVQPGDTVVIIGAGTMGMMNAQVAKAFGAIPILTEVDPFKIERAKAMNVGPVIDSKNSDPVAEVMRLTDGQGADVVIPCVGLTFAYKQAYQMMKKSDARFLIYSAGYPAPEFADEMKDANKVHYGRMEIIGTVGANASDVALAARLISKRLVHPEFMLQQKEAIPLRDIQKAYELAATPGTYRVSVDLQGV